MLKSITGRIILLHIAAIFITSAFMPVALYLLLRSAAEDLQHRSLRENAETITRYIGVDANGQLTLALPSKLETLFSDAYGRYGYSVLDAEGPPFSLR